MLLFIKKRWGHTDDQIQRHQHKNNYKLGFSYGKANQHYPHPNDYHFSKVKDINNLIVSTIFTTRCQTRSDLIYVNQDIFIWERIINPMREIKAWKFTLKKIHIIFHIIFIHIISMRKSNNRVFSYDMLKESLLLT